MPPRQLPDRPNLEQLKKQAKSLLACGAGARQGRAPPLRRVARVLEQIHRTDRRTRSGAPRRAVRDRARARVPVLDGAARRSRSTNAVVRRSGRRVHPLRDRRRGRPREPAARALSRHRARPRCRRRWCSAMPRRWKRGCATIRSSRPNRADRRTGSRCSTCATRACTSTNPPAWTGSSRSRAGSARSGRIRTRNITGTGTRSFRGRRCGARSARSGICRSRKCCSRPARIRPTASRCTSPAAAAISTRSNCCTATAST